MLKFFYARWVVESETIQVFPSVLCLQNEIFVHVLSLFCEQ